VTGRRLRIAGLHHVTLLCKDVERSVAFYRNLLGMRLVKQTVNEDDSGARHLFFGDEEGRPGSLITCLEYPDLDEGSVGRGSTHHFALSVETEEELGGWRNYLVAQGAWDAAKEDAWKAECTVLVDAEIDAYLATKVQPVESMFDYLYAELPHDVREQREAAMAWEQRKP